MLFAIDLSVSAAIICYGIASLLFIQIVPDEPDLAATANVRSPAAQRIEKLFAGRETQLTGLFLIMAVATFFRLFRIDTQPGGLWIDETFTGLNALEILEGKFTPLSGVTPLNRFQPNWVKTPIKRSHFAGGI